MKTIEMFNPVEDVNYYIFAGSTKPYHKGHHEMIMAAINDAAKDPDGEVLLFIGAKGRGKLSGEIMEEIWDNIISRHYFDLCDELNVPIHIDFGGWGPVGKVLHILKTISERDVGEKYCKNKVFIYADKDDCLEYYLNRKYSKKNPSVELKSSPPNYILPLLESHPESISFMGIKFPDRFTRGVGTTDISGTKVRSYIKENDIQNLNFAIPDWMDIYQRNYYVDKLVRCYHENNKIAI